MMKGSKLYKQSPLLTIFPFYLAFISIAQSIQQKFKSPCTPNSLIENY